MSGKLVSLQDGIQDGSHIKIMFTQYRWLSLIPKYFIVLGMANGQLQDGFQDGRTGTSVYDELFERTSKFQYGFQDGRTGTSVYDELLE